MYTTKDEPTQLNDNRQLRFHIEHEWKRSRYFLLNRNIFCRKRLTMNVEYVLFRLKETNHQYTNDNHLQLILLFDNNQ